MKRKADAATDLPNGGPAEVEKRSSSKKKRKVDVEVGNGATAVVEDVAMKNSAGSASSVDKAEKTKKKKEKEEKKDKKEKKSKKEKKQKKEDKEDKEGKNDKKTKKSAVGEMVAEPIAAEEFIPVVDEKADKKAKKEKKKSQKRKQEELEQAEEQQDGEADESQEAAAGEKSKKKDQKSKKKDKKNKKSKTDANGGGLDDEATKEQGEEATSPTEAEQESKKGARFICFIGNLPYTATQASVTSHFAVLKPAAVRLLDHPTDKSKSRGIAFIEFDNYSSMKTCLAKFHHTEFDDGKSPSRKINVELTAGGGGKTDKRQDKIKAKNQKLNEERARRIQKEEQEKEERRRQQARKQSGPKQSAAEDEHQGIHPSRRAQVPQTHGQRW